MTIKAPEGMVFRAYMIGLGLGRQDYVSRVLIDHYGMVFRTGPYIGGWSSCQDFSYDIYNEQGQHIKTEPSFKFIVLPEPIKMWDSNGLWNFWWESKAWQDEAWAWMHYNKRD